MTDRDPLPHWNPGPTKQSILDFVRRVTEPGGSEEVSPEDRIAVFDNDGTLWCEKPIPIQLDFILRRLVEMADQDPSLRDVQPWQAACAGDLQWFGEVITRHYHGDDSLAKVFFAGILSAHSQVAVEEFESLSEQFLRTAPHPTLGRTYLECAYAPMTELLRFLQANGFHNYIASGGGRDFMRPISEEVYGIPRQRVIGSGVALEWRDDLATLTRRSELDVLDDGAEKPVQIWNRTGRRPLLAAGNSNGDIPMLRFAGTAGRPALRLLLLHDDPVREFDYVAGAEQALDRAAAEKWTVASIRDDWATVF